VNRSTERAALARWNIILIGARGAGKTSVGRRLAQRLSRPFVDTDERMERLSGRSVRELFAERGETGFRDLESKTLRQALLENGQVVSVGGGAVVREENRNSLRTSGMCVWLTAPAPELARRVAGDPRSVDLRPALTPLPPGAEMQRLLDERGPLYAQLADLTIETSGREIEQIVDTILASIDEAAPE
jgi:shikimate kinase